MSWSHPHGDVNVVNITCKSVFQTTNHGSNCQWYVSHAGGFLSPIFSLCDISSATIPGTMRIIRVHLALAGSSLILQCCWQSVDWFHTAFVGQFIYHCCRGGDQSVQPDFSGFLFVCVPPSYNFSLYSPPIPFPPPSLSSLSISLWHTSTHTPARVCTHTHT